MKRSEQPAHDTPPPKPSPMQAAGLYGEVTRLPLGRAVHAPFHELKTFL